MFRSAAARGRAVRRRLAGYGDRRGVAGRGRLVGLGRGRAFRRPARHGDGRPRRHAPSGWPRVSVRVRLARLLADARRRRGSARDRLVGYGGAEGRDGRLAGALAPRGVGAAERCLRRACAPARDPGLRACFGPTPDRGCRRLRGLLERLRPGPRGPVPAAVRRRGRVVARGPPDRRGQGSGAGRRGRRRARGAEPGDRGQRRRAPPRRRPRQHGGAVRSSGPLRRGLRRRPAAGPRRRPRRRGPDRDPHGAAATAGGRRHPRPTPSRL